jgi:ATP-dependent helicase/nuclease subunit A
VLGAEQGRRRFLARLGHEADDALDEFLNLALDYERRETPSLQGFIAWLRAAQTDVKRDMEITRDEVRVMTVHGAKGLEARIVVLADTTTPPAGPPQRQPRLIPLAGDGAPHAPDRFVWGRAKTTDVAAVAAAREQARREAEDESRRLLYVAMTRAIDRLVVCGAVGERGPSPGCWWDLVSAALQPVSVEEADDDGDGKVWRYRKVPVVGDATTRADERAASAAASAPPWLGRNAPTEPGGVRLLSPSAAYDEETVAPANPVGSRTKREKARARGVLVHRLLQSLPDIPREARADAARRHLARTAANFDAEERETMVEQVLRLLNDLRFAELFSPGSRAEVSIAGRLAGGAVVVSGQVDRLAVTRDCVLIADYKSNRIAREDGRERPYGSPRLVEDAPAPYIRQLALYRAVLAGVYPDRTIRAALIWTDGPDLMEIPAAALDRELAAVTSS